MLAELGGGTVAKTILGAFAHALVSYWYVWLLMLVVAVALGALNDWSKRFERRRRRRR